MYYTKLGIKSKEILEILLEESHKNMIFSALRSIMIYN